jgi:hypothetical protein
VSRLSKGSVNADLCPEGTDVMFVEADLEGIVGTEGLSAFEGAIKARPVRRREKEGQA